MKISWMDANLIQVAPERHDMGEPARIVVLLAEMRTFKSDRKKKNARNGGSLSNLCRSRRVAPRRWLVGISPPRKQKPRTPFTLMGEMDRLLCSLTTPGGLMLLT
jgi:hypothetical protein